MFDLLDEVWENGNSVGEGGGDQSEACLRHDLRQSLSAVMMLATIIDKRTLDDPAMPGHLDQMRQEVDWMTRILAESRKAGAVTAVDVGELTADIWHVMAQSHACVIRLVRDPAPWVLVDPVTLGRAVRNLIENAVRAAGATGTVEVRVGEHGGSVTVEVADSGPGFGRIPAQQRLGLRTVNRFADDHDGVVLVGDSELGGACVRLMLPAAPSTRLAEESRTPA